MTRRIVLSVLVVGVLAVTFPVALHAQEPQPEESPALDVAEIKLDNGLRIMVLEREASPTFAAMYQFGVGAAFDPEGQTGIAHLLEHMMFKGSRSVGTTDPERETEIMDRLGELWDKLHVQLDAEEDPFVEADADEIARLKEEIEKLSAEHKDLIVKNEYDELMTRAGGVAVNAFTSYDLTGYMVMLPANRLELWFQMEGDRLLNSVFREFYSERDVVISERRQTTENTPGGRMWEALDALMYPAHPYGRPVIGWPADLARLRRDDARDYFTTYYSPSNCTMVLVGDVDLDDVRRLAEKHFGPWQRQQMPRLRVTAEPEQRGERRAVVEFDAEPRLLMGWATVPEGHPDHYPLEVLSDILGGLSSSRLDATVVYGERIASSVMSGITALRFGGQFFAGGSVREGHTVAELEAAIEREIARIADEGVTEDELTRAKITVEVSQVRGLKSNLGQAFRIASAVRMTGSVDYIEEFRRRIEAVTADQIQEVVSKYLVPSRKNVVEVRKVEGAGGGSRGGDFEHQRGGSLSARGQVHSTGFDKAMAMIRASEPVELDMPEIGKDVDRVELESGITLFIKEDHLAPSIDMTFAWLGGANSTPVEALAPFEVADQLLTRGGTEALDPIALQEAKDELGMRFSIGLGETRSRASFWSLERNFEEAFGLAMDMLMRPRLDPERLETIKLRYIDQMQRRYDSPGWGAALVEDHVFFHDHPRLGFQATRAQIEAVTVEDVRQLWQRYIGTDNLYLTVVGDFETEEMKRYLEEQLGSWRKAEDSERVFITREPVVRPGVWVVEKELANPAVRISHQIAVDRRAPMEDHAALEILNDILGGSGFRSRLMERLRSDEGLTYGIYSSVSHDGRPGQPGSIDISYQTGAETVAKSVGSVLEEFAGIIAEKVTEAEVEEQVEAWRNRFIFNYVSDFYSVSRLMFAELDDRDYDYDAQLLEAVQKVAVDDVLRVAKRYLKPEHLTVSIFGTLTEADRQALEEELDLEVLDRTEVFSGGYEVKPKEAATASP